MGKNMIILDNKPVTDKIFTCYFYAHKHGYFVKFKNNYKSYFYSSPRLCVLTNATPIDLEKYDFYYQNEVLDNVKAILEYEYNHKYFYRVIYQNNKQLEYPDSELIKYDKKYKDVLEYMKKVSNIISLETETGKKILTDQINKIKVDNLQYPIANYFKLSNDLKTNNDMNCFIFPFGCNESQYHAVVNAINHKISVIEGPPGTGKTQTILNIIANLIIRNKNCQVASNNNAAIKNVEEKLQKYGLDYIMALLGKRENKDFFIENQKNSIPSFEEYQELNLKELETKVKSYYDTIQKLYLTKQKLANLKLLKTDYELEYKYFQKSIDTPLIALKKVNTSKIFTVWKELDILDSLSYWNKLKYVFFYKIGNFKFYKQDLGIVKNTTKDLCYKEIIKNLDKEIEECTSYIDKMGKCEEEFIDYSMKYLKKYLSCRYQTDRKIYSQSEIRNNSDEFIKDYPVILSTTYSSRNTFKENFKFDYIIMDEASQIDVATGSLALSSAKNAVIIGDEMQLENVVTEGNKEEDQNLFKQFMIDSGYAYSQNSFLKSVKQIIPYAPNTLLREHYRCHPKIINFCNKKFYHNQLIIMTEDHGEKDVLKIIRTNKGNHARDNTNQRQLDIIVDLLKNNRGDVGVIAPFNDQVNLIKQSLPNVDVSTVHKFQGREKDMIVVSTVQDDIKDFVANDNILNVAISRAKKKLVFIVTGNEIKNKNINDFIDYVAYNNMEISTSNINSVFDLLYSQYTLERLEFYKKHNKISNFDSENFIYYLLNKIMEDYNELDFNFLYPMKDLILDTSLLNEEEARYAKHHATHIDFLVFNKISKKPVLAIEVDGYKVHKEGTKQHERDLLKNSILSKYDIPLIRLKTNGSEEEKKIRNALSEMKSE